MAERITGDEKFQLMKTV